MSIQAIAWVLENSVAEGYDRLVLLAIANHVDARGFNAWPSIEHIAREARVGRSTVFRSLEVLIRLGELEIVQRGGGRNKPNHYQLPMKRSQAATLWDPERVPAGDKRVPESALNGPACEPGTKYNRQEPYPARAPAREAESATRASRDASTPKDDLAVRAARVVPGTSYSDARALIAQLEDEGVGRLVIDEAIGFALGRDDVKSLGFLRQVAHDWMRQRDESWAPKDALSNVRAIRKNLKKETGTDG